MVSFRSYPWEQKGFVYYLKDCVRYRPHMLLFAPFYLLIVPGICWYTYKIEPKTSEQLSRFRPRLLVYRDDDPRVRDIIKFDENGKRIHLEPRTN